MPHYFIDLKEGDHLDEDDEGAEFRSLAEARDVAARTLPQIASDHVPDCGDCTFSAIVRDASHKPVYEAVVTFEEKRLTA